MSRIGKQIIQIPNGVQVSLQGNDVTVKGPKGELNYTHLKNVKVVISDNQVSIQPVDDTKETKAFWGLTRTLVNNMVIGVSEGFKKELEIIGVGFKAQVQGDLLTMSLGFSHLVEYKIPLGVKIEQRKEKNEILTISGINKELVGQTAAQIRAIKKPEPYKGKGIKYMNEVIVRKEGKTAGSK